MRQLCSIIACSLCGFVLASTAGLAAAQDATPASQPSAAPPPAAAPTLPADAPLQPDQQPAAATPARSGPTPASAATNSPSVRLYPQQQPAGPSWAAGLAPDADAYQIVSAGHGLSLHKPMYVLPLTYSDHYHGHKTEMLFQISLKQRLFGMPLYFGYTQKSFFDIYDSPESKPFRATDYNPELFYRYIPADVVRWHHLGADFGIEHESNGKGLPDSRSWNRIYLAPFQLAGEHVIYWKWWWRIPENKSLPRTDPNRDDNPDIGSYYGYSELHYEQQLLDRHLLHLMGRYNPVTGRGALSLQYTIPNNAADPSFFWMFTLWQGYGESLIDYNHSITRVGVGVALAR